MKKNYPCRLNLFFSLFLFVVFASLHQEIHAQSFNESGLSGETLLNPTSLDFGPDGRLYVSQQDGTILAYTVVRDDAAPGSGSYSVTATETINNIKTGVPNHNDDGTVNTLSLRQVTGLLAAGSATNPVLYVSSSDSRIGGKAAGEDLNLDTNSGVLSRLTWNGSAWERVDLVRGLPRCEENHSTNGMDLYQSGGTTYLLLQQGGNTNKGAPSNNFAGTSETYLAGALLRINITQLNGMPLYTDPRNGASYVYDLPTLNDPEREDITNTHPAFPYPAGHPMRDATIDLGDPFGGNDGLNQAISEPGAPVQIFSPGYRNGYDVVVREDGTIYTSDNGPNSGWGGVPVIYDSGGNVKANQSVYDPGNGDYVTNDFNEANASTVWDGLHFVGSVNDADGAYYGGHPVPIRAFPSRAGVVKYEFNGSDWVVDATHDFGDLLNGVSGYFNSSFTISDFPDDDRQGEYLVGNLSSPKVNILDVVSSSTNGICEYTASNFEGAMQGNILSASFNGNINRYVLNASGADLLSKDNGFLTPFGTPLDVIAQGDGDPFPGTIWAATYGANNITVFEPADFGDCPQSGEPGFDPLADSDSDGYTNGDEADNGTNPCSAGSKPADNDGDLVSDLNDPDDDNDGIPDVSDAFAIDPDNGTTTSLPVNYPFWNNDPGTGFFGLGFTGLMLDPVASTDYLTQYDPDNLSFGGAGGKATIDAVTQGDALGNTNTQENGFQLGADVDSNSAPFTVYSKIENPFGTTEAQPGQSQGIYIGAGDQDNYLKVVAMNGTTADDGIDGILVLLEEGGGISSSDTYDIPGLTAATTVELYISVDPAANTAQPYYSLDAGNSVLALGSPITLPLSFLDDDDDKGMAAGIIATADGGEAFVATWDFLNITEDGPANLELDPDPVDFGTLAVDSGPAQLNVTALNSGGPSSGSLEITAISVTGTDAALFSSTSSLPILIGPGAGKTLQINFTPDSNPGTKTASLNITHTGANSPLAVPLTATLSDIAPVSRVNAGGVAVPASDGLLDWEANNASGAVSGTTYSVNTGSVTSSGLAYANRHASIPDYIDQATFEALFLQERFDLDSGPEMEFSFPLADGLYLVNLYLGNNFAGTSGVGQRVFDIEMEGAIVQDNMDLIAEFGHQAGGMIAIPVPVSDGVLNVRFLHEVQNPLVNAIEILDASGQQITFDIFPIDDTDNTPGETVSIKAVAYGGDDQAPVSYSITGQPEGITINATTGVISGTVSVNALAGGPNGDGLHNVTVTASRNGSADAEEQFSWAVSNFTSFRINAGGSLVAATDSETDWRENASSGTYSGDGYTVNTGGIFNSNLLYVNRHTSIPGYIDEATFNALFAQERFDTQGGLDMEFSVPLLNGNYTVNLYMGNSFSGTSEPGQRVYNILMEGDYVRQNFDLIVEFGHQSGGMVSFPVEVADGELNIGFEMILQSPLVNAIEILADNSLYPPIIIDPIADQTNQIGESANLSISASGGNPEANFSFSISGQPAGIDVEPTNGQIFGTIASDAATGGPNGDGVHQVTVLVNKPGSLPATTGFTWTIEANWVDKNENENYTGRHECSFVQAGDKFYLMGGRENARTIDIYDYTSDTWNSLVDSAPLEFNHYQATEYKGLIWIIGAFKDNIFPVEEPADHIWIFDPGTSEWIEGPEIPEARKRGSTGLVVYNDKFYIVGGNTIGHDGGYVSWFDEYDPATGQWTSLTDAPRARDHFHAVVIGDKLYAAGGRLSGGDGGVFAPTIPEVDVYDFTNGTWSSLPAGQNIPTQRAGAAAVNFEDRLVVIGGELSGSGALNVTEEYNPETESWRSLADMNHSRHGTQAIVSGDGIYILGGSPNLGGGNQKNMEYLGADNATGVPSLPSILTAPSIVDVEDESTRSFNLNVSEGNIGVYIRSMVISGPDAADFSIVSGELANGLINPLTDHEITIGLSGTGADRNAVLTINYGTASSLTIDLTNNNIGPVVDNPGDQFNNEGDVVSLQIEASDASADLSYSATGLPPDLSIDPVTGLITGTVSEAQAGEGAFLEENGLVIIEAESGTIVPNWSLTNLDGETGIIAGTDHLTNQNGGTIPYQINISTPGVYRFNWNSLYSGSSASDENDNWLRFPNNEDVWFFGYKGTVTEAAIISSLESENPDNVVYPKGSSRDGQGAVLNGAGGNGFFKVYKSSGGSGNYTWQSLTGDGQGFHIYLWFVNPGTYTMEISERSAGHAIDRVALYKVGGPSYSDAQLDAAPESARSAGTEGAAANSPYNVTVTVTDEGDPPQDTQIDFVWNIGESGNEPPVAIAGATPSIGDAPLEVSFTGSNSTDDNGISSYLWDFKDGSIDTDADPVHIFSDPGTYMVSLTVTDGNGFSDTANITITVLNPDGNEAPVAVASADPLSGAAPLEVLFTGSNSTDDVGIVSYFWDFMDGTTSANSEAEHTFTLEGTYEVMLTVTDGDGLNDTATVTIEVGPEENNPPQAFPGASPDTGVAPLEVSFVGSNSTDDFGIVSYSWDFMDGGTANVADPVYTFTTPGIYEVELTVTDGGGLSDTGIVTITVSGDTGIPPVADAGPDQEIILPTNSIVLDGSGSDPDGGFIVSYLWTQQDGPNAATLSGADTEDLTAGDLVEGVYIFRLTVTDDEGESGSDEVTVTVLSESSTQAPIANAGPDQTITLPENSLVLDGSGSDPDGGVIVSYLWTQQSGPDTATLTGADTEDLTAGDLIEGDYVFTLTVTDDEGETGFDEVNVTVLPEGATQVPIANAGPDQTITLPENSLVLDGSGSDPDGGAIVSYQWTQQDGPGTATLSGADTEDLTASDLVEGVYIFQLNVTDDEGEMGTDEVSVTVVSGEGNVPPVALISADPQSGNAPLQVSFTGSGSTDDVGIVSYAWDFGDGFTSDLENPAHTFTEPGEFTVSLTVEDGDGLTDTVTVTITVSELEEDMVAILLENPAYEGVARVRILNQPAELFVLGLYLHDYSGRFISQYNGQEIFDAGDWYEVPVSTLRDGLYFITLIMNSGEPLPLKLLVKN